jgi:hypothetical protein
LATSVTASPSTLSAEPFGVGRRLARFGFGRLTFDRTPERNPFDFLRLLRAAPPARPRSAAPPASAGIFAFSATFATVDWPPCDVERPRCAVPFWAVLPLPLCELPLEPDLLDADVLRLVPEAFRLVARLLDRPLRDCEPEDFALEPLEFERFELVRFDPADLDRALELVAWAMLFPFLKIVRGCDVYPAVPPLNNDLLAGGKSRNRCKGGGGQDTLRRC